MMVTAGKLSASLEDYLEAIFWIAQSKGAARAKDIATKLSVKASSVTGALQALKEKKYDIVVSDINMPRMDGFSLTSKIRSDQKLNRLPVVLVTALKSLEDREHGMDVGANAYIIKDTFNPEKLLEIVKKLE